MLYLTVHLLNLIPLLYKSSHMLELVKFSIIKSQDICLFFIPRDNL